jgi:5-methylcytosine-specific restriction protein A
MAAGSLLDADVWAEFHHHPGRLHSIANAIREIIITSSDEKNEVGGDEIEAPEGMLLTQYHRSRERARELVSRKKEGVLRSGKGLICEVCDFDFAARYGSRGIGFIECHHREPLASLAPGTKTKLADLALVCSNCHSMQHRGNPWPSVDELRRSLGLDPVH